MRDIFGSETPESSGNDLVCARLALLYPVQNRLDIDEMAKVLMLLTVREGEYCPAIDVMDGISAIGFDCSPSMSGDKLKATKAAMIDCVPLVPDGSSALILSFHSRAAFLGIVQGNDPASQAKVAAAIKATRIGDGTSIGSVLNMGLDKLRGYTGPRSITIVSDGLTNDAKECLRLAALYAKEGIVINFLGTDDVDVDFARQLTDLTGGRLEYLRDLTGGGLGKFLGEQMDQALSAIIQNVTATVTTSGNVQMIYAAKAYPDVIPAQPGSPCTFGLGNIPKNDCVKGYFEILVPQPSCDSEVIAGEVVVSYAVPRIGKRSLALPISVRFEAGALRAPDADVLRAMQLVKAQQDMIQASAAQSPAAAIAHLTSAQRRTQVAGDSRKTQIIGEMMTNIRATSVVSDEVRKTAITVGRRTKIAS